MAKLLFTDRFLKNGAREQPGVSPPPPDLIWVIIEHSYQTVGGGKVTRDSFAVVFSFGAISSRVPLLINKTIARGEIILSTGEPLFLGIFPILDGKYDGKGHKIETK